MRKEIFFGVALFLGSGAAAAQDSQWYPPPAPGTEARPPAVTSSSPQAYPAPVEGGQQQNPAEASGGRDNARSAKTGESTKPTGSQAASVALIERVEDAKNPAVETLQGARRTMPLAQGRSWKVYTRGVEGGAGGRQFWLTQAKIAPVKLRSERWDEGEMIVVLPAGSIAESGTYRIELHQDGSLLAARTVRVITELPDDFDHDGVGRDRDCDDFDPRRYPGAKEVCDAAGLDEDCDASTVAGENAYVDADGDGFGAGEAVLLCGSEKMGRGYARTGGDCNDHDPSVKPGGGCH